MPEDGRQMHGKDDADGPGEHIVRLGAGLGEALVPGTTLGTSKRPNHGMSWPPALDRM